ncbi:TatD family hydrolase [Patescibacteria group bacterium]|nr:TatD family hydrolase [Patescibacteria group bacterium]
MLIDSHCHLPHERYDISVDDILAEAKDFGVEKFINIGTSVEENIKSIETANKYPQVFCSIGIYPHENRTSPIPELMDSLEGNLNMSKKIVAVGECGIDISNIDDSRPLEEQFILFGKQIEFAKKNNLPLIVHNRNGDEHLLKILKEHLNSNLIGVVHCFDSDWDFAKKVLDIGFYISFTNMITYPNKENLLDVVKKVPEDRFLVETDAPWLPPQSLRGKINYPKYVKIVAEKVAQVKQKTFEEVSERSYANTCSLFKL